MLCYSARKITYSEVGKIQKKEFLRVWYTLVSKIPIDVAFFLFHIYSSRSRNDSPNRVRMLSYGRFCRREDKYSNGKAVYGRPKQWVREVKEFDFEGFRLFGPAEAELFLTKAYGENFMTPPPLEKRVANSPCSSYSFGRAEPVYSKYKESE